MSSISKGEDLFLPAQPIEFTLDRELLMFLFEVKEISPSPYGYKLVAKNVPDDNFYVTADFYKLLH
ncbi:hypothetical protein ABAC402_08985 [Asticcacaulis sp. AC402]|nr:hypothetical protein ABAC402_08985 [Asticcacaulis sp. AC402]